MQLFIVLWASVLFAAAQDSQSSPAGLQEAVPKELPGLHNVHRATKIVYLGSEPHGEEAFISLKKLGVTTIVSVDGATPDVELAKKHGLRYIHIPTGYDGVDEVATKALTRVAWEIKTPLYVHCHHGKHRGPAAAAIVCLASGTLTHDQAIGLMKTAGTRQGLHGTLDGRQKLSATAGECGVTAAGGGRTAGIFSGSDGTTGSKLRQPEASQDGGLEAVGRTPGSESRE